MARLTLSEQVNDLASKLSTVTAQLHSTQQQLATTEGNLNAQIGEAQRLRAQLEDLPALREQVIKLTKERDDAKSSVTYHSAEATKAANEIEQAHAVLDGVDGAPPRSYRPDDSSYDRQRNVVTRLAGAFLAIAKNGGAK
jgi:chromosome segregation ATPase